MDELYSKVGQCPDGKLCFNKKLSNVPIGSYVSMTPTSKSYTISKEFTGFDIDQIINPSELNLWRVIKQNGDGTVEMVSDKISSKKVFFKNKIGYINYIKVLNTISEQYTDGKNILRSRQIGYSNQTETIVDTSKIDQVDSSWATSTSLDTQWENCSLDKYLCGKDEMYGAGDIGYVYDYILVNNVYGTMVATTPSGSPDNYLLASRILNRYANGIWYFRGRMVNESGGLGMTHYMYSYDRLVEGGISVSQAGSSIRPIIVIKAETKINGGTGSANSPYYLSD